MKQNEQLNGGQSNAVMHADGPCVVIAPPGSGKTKVLTLRIGALIENHGVLPKHILVVTFTRSAAEQMRERYLQNCERTDTEVTFGTFHAVFYRILRESIQMGAKLDGYRVGQTLRILSEREKKEILAAIVNQTKERRAQFPDMEQLCACISKWKNRMEAKCSLGSVEGRTSAESVSRSAGCGGGEESSADDSDRIGEEILQEYNEACAEFGGLDFEDITDRCFRLLRDERNARILAYWRDQYRYFLVDEFQDISPMQFSILGLLAAPRDNLFVVGDDDQSIYGFRGSDTKLMLALSTYYPQIRTCYLKMNYRSGRRIVDAAKHLIERNRLRYEKEITAGMPVDGTVRLVVCEEKKTQVRAVCEMLHMIPEDETAAVIVRTNAQAAEMARLIGQAGICIAAAHGREPKNMYAHPIAKDVLAYLTLAVAEAYEQDCVKSIEGAYKQDCVKSVEGAYEQDCVKPIEGAYKQDCTNTVGSALPQGRAKTGSVMPAAEHMEAMLRIINKPYRSVSRQAVIASGGSIAALLKFYEGNESVEKTLRLFQRQLQCLAKLPPCAAIAYLCRGIGYGRTLPEAAVRGGEARAEALAVLSALNREAKEVRNHKAWLHAAADGRCMLASLSPMPCRIQMLTMHACKGLEFDHVVLPGLNEGVIPHKKACLPEEIEEERRLLYVAMTRARKALLMTCVHKQGDQKFQMSRFLRSLI